MGGSLFRLFVNMKSDDDAKRFYKDVTKPEKELHVGLYKREKPQRNKQFIVITGLSKAQ